MTTIGSGFFNAIALSKADKYLTDHRIVARVLTRIEADKAGALPSMPAVILPTPNNSGPPK